MTEFYPQIKSVHVAMIMASGVLFALLTAALMLLSILPWAMFGNGWLVLKVGLLVVYVVLGFMVLRPGRSRQARAALYISALLVYGCMYSIARAHHPLGLLRGFIAA
jgi:uncharacterized membrane protein SirB2